MFSIFALKTRSRLKNFFSKHGTMARRRKSAPMEPERSDQDKRGKIPLDVHEEKIECKMQPERRMLESSRASTGIEVPGQPRLLDREMRLIIIGGC